MHFAQVELVAAGDSVKIGFLGWIDFLECDILDRGFSLAASSRKMIAVDGIWPSAISHGIMGASRHAHIGKTRRSNPLTDITWRFAGR